MESKKPTKNECSCYWKGSNHRKVFKVQTFGEGSYFNDNVKYY